MTEHQTKYIFVTGGVVSSLGKGIAAASLGAILENRGLNISILKLDPYLNVDPGTMNPYQHGEVFVTEDGAETDLDLGHYERYLSKNLSRLNSKTAGQIYKDVLEKERKGDYLGATVQVIPHVTNEIKLAIKNAAQDQNVLICEVGGTVGDIESLPFLEAIRQMRTDEGYQNSVFVHVSFVPTLSSTGEIKTKPTQHSVKELLSIGIQPDVLLLRTESKLPAEIKNKISLFCNVPTKGIINCPNMPTVYEVPLILKEEGIDDTIIEHLNIWARKANLKPWEKIVDHFLNPDKEVNIGIVGKYASLTESYKSINEALIHAGIAHKIQINRHYIDAEEIEKNSAKKILADFDAILVPGGFGLRGTQGKIEAVRFAREKKIPFLGICLGLQIAVIEFAQNVAKIKGATSGEFDAESKTQVISVMEDQKHVKRKGGTMRLGSYPCVLQKSSKAYEAFGLLQISERHRHRFEVNNAFRAQLAMAGLVFSGLSPDKELVEIIELNSHPFFVAVQSHPEFLSRPFAPHPLFNALVKAALKNK